MHGKQTITFQGKFCISYVNSSSLDCAVPGKIHTHGHPMEGQWQFLEGGAGVLKVKVLEAKYETKLEFPGGVGVQTKTFCGGRYSIRIFFWSCTLFLPLNFFSSSDMISALQKVTRQKVDA